MSDFSSLVLRMMMQSPQMQQLTTPKNLDFASMAANGTLPGQTAAPSAQGAGATGGYQGGIGKGGTPAVQDLSVGASPPGTAMAIGVRPPQGTGGISKGGAK